LFILLLRHDVTTYFCYVVQFCVAERNPQAVPRCAAVRRAARRSMKVYWVIFNLFTPQLLAWASIKLKSSDLHVIKLSHFCFK